MMPPTAQSQEAKQRVRFTALTPLRRFPVTITLTAAVVVIGILTGTVFRNDHQSILNAVGFDLETLESGRFWTMPAATLVQAQPGIKWHMALLVLVLGPLEYLAGSVRALATFFLTDWVSTPLTTLTLWAMAAVGSDTAERLVHTPDMGSSAAAFGTIAATAPLLPGPLGAAVLGGLLLFLGAEFTFQALDVAIAHLVAAAIGVALGQFVWRRQATIPNIR
jgi:hypothetical protein